MAKGLRASTERTNRRKLRANVFGPVEKARAERLHAKLLATINSEKPARPAKKEMDVDVDVDEEGAQPKESLKEDMDVDDKTTKKPHRSQSEKKTKKERARKPRNSITFPKTRGKGALKPFTGKSRVSKRK
ncbi:uncharacterized protein M421DRAFT_416132 [Didymella exigua CBS 183.55]|uniref:DUF2423 domain-containing protein n=1 Tax=Didymella exigua CBS 183.55 TaxID=1150837 RepID=A0A6A5S2E2_9PLEO|nr:uncharacterized protein M421DRAFT_416132 [Didymella exigua CBS 183.55]KAF1933780.1 hypothetical protein M421DRAFT_416132 [Didymella exigua CBS 183.55]